LKYGIARMELPMMSGANDLRNNLLACFNFFISVIKVRPPSK